MSWLLLCHDLFAGRPAEAAARLDASEVTTVLQPWMRPWVLAQMAEAHVELGHEAEGQELLHAAFECAKGSDTCFWLLESMRVRARLLITQKLWIGAAEQLDELLPMGRRGPFPYDEARALYEYGWVHFGCEERAAGPGPMGGCTSYLSEAWSQTLHRANAASIGFDLSEALSLPSTGNHTCPIASLMCLCHGAWVCTLLSGSGSDSWVPG